MKQQEREREIAYKTTPYDKDVLDKVFEAFPQAGTKILDYCTSYCLDPLDVIKAIQKMMDVGISAGASTDEILKAIKNEAPDV